MEVQNKLFVNIMKGVGIALLSTVVSLMIFSVILTYTNISEQVINPVTIVITGISILIGSSIGNIKIKKNGLINGALVGLFYMVIIYLVSSILNWNFSFNLYSIIFIVVGVIFGMLGGIIGVNRK